MTEPYYIYDSRFFRNPERAVCLAIADTLDEAVAEAARQGDMNCIEYRGICIGFVADGKLMEAYQ